MNIVLDGLLLFLNNGQVGNYSRSIVDNLIKYSNADICIIKDYEINSNKYSDNAIELLLDRKSNDYSNLSFFLKNADYNLHHCLNNGFSIPKNFDFNYIMTINNLLPINYEELCNVNYVSNFFSKMPYGVLNSKYIVCPSITTKENFLESFSMDEDKVFVNYGVVSNFYRKIDSFLSLIYIKSKFKIDKEFIVFSGDFHKRKQIDKCLILFSELKKYIKDLKFIIMSYDFLNNEYLNELKSLSKKLNILEDVIYLSKPSIMDKVNIFNSCLFFIDLSIYEDVNIDIVEVFSCRTPIICSDISLYKEYFGDCVFYYNDDIDSTSILNYTKKYKCIDKELVLSKFESDINIKSSLNIYNKLR